MVDFAPPASPRSPRQLRTPRRRVRALTSDGSLQVLRFAATFLWADGVFGDEEQSLLLDFARELGVPPESFPAILELLVVPPFPEEVDPQRVGRALAARIRSVALQAIARRGRVGEKQMRLFDLLDQLLPKARRIPLRDAA